VKVAAYQAPLLPSGSLEALELIRTEVDWCEQHGIAILCCPEAILGGLADDASHPNDIAIGRDTGELGAILAPLASQTVTTILGFTERGPAGRLYNSAAVFHRGSVIGLYRKRHPAIHRSIYDAGDETPVFKIDGLTFGVLICNDSNHPEVAKRMVSAGARALFIPTNNGLPAKKANVVAQAREVDIARALENRVPVIRADVTGHTGLLVSYGSSAIVDGGGRVLQSAAPFSTALIAADI
jgi:predicted amidohydrolase